MLLIFFFFFFNDTATTEIYTLSLHDALPICGTSSSSARSGSRRSRRRATRPAFQEPLSSLARTTTRRTSGWGSPIADRKSTRLNSSHGYISYAVFCLKKKKKHNKNDIQNITP